MSKIKEINVRLAAEMNSDACETYGRNLGRATIWPVNLSEVNAAEILERAGLKFGEADLIVGGPPCQGFSSAGARDWQDPRNALLRRFVTHVTDIKPTWFIMENVEGLLTASEGYYFIEAILRFLQAGYWVRAKKIYMETEGVAQRRKRVFIVGNLEETPFDFAEPSHLNGYPSLFDQERALTVMDAICDLPTLSDQPGYYMTPPQCTYQTELRRQDGKPVTLHQNRRLSALNTARIQHLKAGETMQNLPVELQHTSFTRRAFRRVMDGTPTERRGGAPSGLKRLKADEPSLTITSAAATEFLHPVEDRPLTLRECARIQSFPDWFDFEGSWSSIATQIGNAIPPLFMEKLVNHVMHQAEWRRCRSQHGRWLGINATKSTGSSPVLNKMLSRLEEKASDYA